MATGIINNASYKVRKTISRARRTELEDVVSIRFATQPPDILNGNDDMVKSHDLLVMLG